MDKPLFLSGTIYVDRSVIDIIKKDAIEAHKKAYDKQSLGNPDVVISKGENGAEDNNISSMSETNVHNITSKNTEHEVSIDDNRLKQVINIVTFAATFINTLKIAEEFINVQDEVIECISNDLLVYEMLFDTELYNTENKKAKDILDNLNIKAISIAIYSILDLSKDFPDVRTGEIYGEISEVICKDIQSGKDDIYFYEKDELKKYFVASIKLESGN